MPSLSLRFLPRAEIELNAGRSDVPSRVLSSFAQCLTHGGADGPRARFVEDPFDRRYDHLVIFEPAPELTSEPPGFVTAYVTGGEAR